MARETTILADVTNSFLMELREHYPDHRMGTAPARDPRIIEGEKETVVSRPHGWVLNLLWYNIHFLPDGIRVEGPGGRVHRTKVIPYEDPRLFEHVCSIIDYLVQS